MKRAVSLILVLSMFFALVSCVADYKNNSLASAAEKMSVSYSDARQDGYVEFLEKLERFAAKLTYEVYSGGEKQSNVCISPISVYMALALATECAGGETRAEILDAVGVSYDEVISFTKYLYAFSNREFYYRDLLENRQVSAFEELANSLWASKAVRLKQSCIDDLATNYHCDLFAAELHTDEGEKAINSYIKDKTHGIIDGGIDLSPETVITLINTFYLKEVWNTFGDKLTFTDKAYDFKNADGSITSTKLLQGYYFNGQAYEGDGYTSFYTRTEHGFDIKFILPTEGHSLDEVFTEENIYTINNLGDYESVDDENMLLYHTRVFFPEYKASFDGNLLNILNDRFGIDSLFDVDRCNLSTLTDDPVYFSSVIHKCSLDVNARGIEGAAVTVMVGDGAAGPGEYEDVYQDYIVDRAFGFVISDHFGAVLFSGVVNGIE